MHCILGECCVVIAVHLHGLIWLFETTGNATHSAPLSSTVSWSLLTFMFIELAMLSTISSSAFFFSSCLQFFPASVSFPISQFFTSGSQNTGASASTSLFAMNPWGWFPLGVTGKCCRKWMAFDKQCTYRTADLLTRQWIAVFGVLCFAIFKKKQMKSVKLMLPIFLLLLLEEFLPYVLCSVSTRIDHCYLSLSNLLGHTRANPYTWDSHTSFRF